MAVASSVVVVDSVAVARSVCLIVSMAVTKMVATADSVAMTESVFRIVEVLVTVTVITAVLIIVVVADAWFRMQEQALESLAGGYVFQPVCEVAALFATRVGKEMGVETARGCTVSSCVAVVVVKIVAVFVSVRVVVLL